MKQKKAVTYKDIVSYNPCYDPAEIGMPGGYSATIPDFIDEYRGKVNEPKDIMWLLCRNEYLTDKDLRLFAVWCARQSISRVENPDTRWYEACNVAERFAQGEATDEELKAAHTAAKGVPFSIELSVGIISRWDIAREAVCVVTADMTAEDAAHFVSTWELWLSTQPITAITTAQIDKLKEIFSNH
jgi:hypothetical protein